MEESKVNLFKRKGAAIGKLAALNLGYKSKEEQMKQKAEQERNAEMFRKKRESIKKDQENKKRLSMKVNQLQFELLGIGGDDDEDNQTNKKDDDMLSVSSGEGEVFVHNLMGFWT